MLACCCHGCIVKVKTHVYANLSVKMWCHSLDRDSLEKNQQLTEVTRHTTHLADCHWQLYNHIKLCTWVLSKPLQQYRAEGFFTVCMYLTATLPTSTPGPGLEGPWCQLCPGLAPLCLPQHSQASHHDSCLALHFSKHDKAVSEKKSVD